MSSATSIRAALNILFEDSEPSSLNTRKADTCDSKSVDICRESITISLLETLSKKDISLLKKDFSSAEIIDDMTRPCLWSELIATSLLIVSILPAVSFPVLSIAVYLNNIYIF